MRTFNNSDLFTGYLKQLLHDFNLPKIKVYTEQHQQYAAQHKTERPDILGTVEADLDNKAYNKSLAATAPAESYKNVRYFPYIKDGQIQEYVNSKWQNIRNNAIKPLALSRYSYGDPILNYTKNLKINSNTYDSYTHEYLGDYLRFHRDFLNLNLMPLYNCFSNRACDKLNLHWKLTANDTQVNVSFNSADQNFKIYMLPVKLFQKYTIAIDSDLPIELCCGIYGDYQDKRTKFATLPQHTYRRLPTSMFSQPFLYDALAYTDDDTTAGFIDRILDSKIADKSTLIELAQNECDLKLFIKVPAHNDSTIVVLEGDYCNWNNAFWDSSVTADKKRCNQSIINVENLSLYSDHSIALITPLQLLHFNTKEQHPFADRLIEYLIGNAITNSETELSDNIKRAQKALSLNSSANNYRKGIPGVWSNTMRILFYEYMTSGASPLTNKFEINHDILGYVDKDVEKFYQASVASTSSTQETISLSSIELEEGDK